uniref:Uncharacterized protein n=1 Tax=uncultured bacterium pAY4-1 TaxID=1781157 RepID=A0A1C9U4T2_9BACT|nr:hypothetical protein [uncultured bacterium pAY4-1]
MAQQCTGLLRQCQRLLPGRRTSFPHENSFGLIKNYIFSGVQLGECFIVNKTRDVDGNRAQANVRST